MVANRFAKIIQKKRAGAMAPALDCGYSFGFRVAS